MKLRDKLYLSACFLTVLLIIGILLDNQSKKRHFVEAHKNPVAIETIQAKDAKTAKVWKEALNQIPQKKWDAMVKAKTHWYKVAGKMNVVGNTGMYVIPIEPDNRGIQLATVSEYGMTQARAHVAIGELLAGTSKLEVEVYPWSKTRDSQIEYIATNVRRVQ